ncbi:RNA-directed DNA polymerase, eukaryota, reverse transcriptase zinc-binding domain protein [Tanacetum coccineum]|uniref:RNA-directed DNA polymerase, eukaryota, reverse transcriptase zinc-binding domain protein n=1 Tax=Tanacetum coccineum TaxID=301880 RepID=A0ABQ5FHA1_9ASTR
MDGPIILNEILNWCKKEKKKTFIFKVDFEKAYDSVCWDYLQDVMFKTGFGRKWCAWIRGCLESSVTSILVNGSPTDEFKIRRGLRQGDPLSLFLFILAMEGLHMLISRAIHSSQLHGLQIGNGDVTVSHLFYADDVIFLEEWNVRNVSNIVLLLQCFFLVSGLKINLAKCRLMGVGVPIGEITEMANIIGCEASTIPFVYLGVPVGANMTRIESWKDLIDKFKTSDTDENKMTWIKWNKVMASKKDGGLGIGSLYRFNRALLFKWKWRFMAYPSAFWVLVIKSLFGHHGGMQDSEPRGNAGSIWINILKVSRELEKKNVHLDDFLKRKVGDGLVWRPGSGMIIGLNLAPNAPFLRRNPRGGGEKDQWVALLSLLETHVSSNQRDRWIWTGDGDGIYSVKCGRKLIDKGTLCLDTHATRWLKEMPTKVNIFLWRMLLNKLPTRMNLMNRGITMQSNQCGICDTWDETVNHLMLHCDLDRDVWALIGRWWTLDFLSVLSIRDLMSWVDDTRPHILAKKVLHVVVGTTTWSIWNFRNQNVFQEEKPKKALLFDSIVSTSFFWLSNRNNNFRINWIGFLQDPIMACNSL